MGLDLPRIDFSLIDNTAGKNPNLPKSFYVWVRPQRKNVIEANSLAWQLDIHLVTDENAKGKVKVEEIKQKLTPEKKLSILQIKKEIATNPKYHREVFSVDIYDAVLDHGVGSLEGFRQYMKARSIEL